MRVLDPGPGELIDRLSILSIKARTAGIQQRWAEKKEFEIEHAQLEGYLHSNFQAFCPGSTMFQKYHKQLTAVNSQIWSCVDRGHQFDLNDRLYSENARLTVRLNDRRAQIIGEVNEMGGIRRKEKL